MSFSKLTCFEDCKYCYYLSYCKECGSCDYHNVGKCFNVDSDYFLEETEKNTSCPHHKRKRKKENAMAQFGSFCHELLEMYEKGELTLEELPSQYEALYSLYVTEEFPPNPYVDLAASYYEGGLKFFEEFDGFGDYTVLASEDEFCENLTDKIKIKGFIDLQVKNKDGEVCIIDHKSKSKFKSKAELAKYTKQLYMYAFRIKKKFGKPPKEIIFNLFRKQQQIKQEFSEEEYQKTLQWIVDVVDQINAEKDWEPTYDEFRCKYLCDFREECEFKEWQVN